MNKQAELFFYNTYCEILGLIDLKNCALFTCTSYEEMLGSYNTKKRVVYCRRCDVMKYNYTNREKAFRSLPYGSPLKAFLEENPLYLERYLALHDLSSPHYIRCFNCGAVYLTALKDTSPYHLLHCTNCSDCSQIDLSSPDFIVIKRKIRETLPNYLTAEEKDALAEERFWGVIEKSLPPCECGGNFKHKARPRCFQCLETLSGVSHLHIIEDIGIRG